MHTTTTGNKIKALKRDARELVMDAQTLQKAANGFLARGRQTRNVHLGSCRKMDAEAALQMARKVKADALMSES